MAGASDATARRNSHTSLIFLPPASNDLARPEVADLLFAVAETGQHLVVVGAESRRDTDPGRRFGELPRRAMHLELLAVLGVAYFRYVAVGQNVGVVGGFEQRVDWRRHDVGFAQPGDPVVARTGG